MDMDSSMIVSLGAQQFDRLRERGGFYVDKTAFIQEWWESGADVTLITRPRRFGKTLNMSMLECFFSNQYAGRGVLFEGLEIWKNEKYRQLQGTYPVIFLSFAGVKAGNMKDMKAMVKIVIANLYGRYREILKSDKFDENDREAFRAVNEKMEDVKAQTAINMLCLFLQKYYEKEVLVLLDEYDTPMQEAWIGGYWEEAAGFFRSFFDNTFKTNPCLYHGNYKNFKRKHFFRSEQSECGHDNLRGVCSFIWLYRRGGVWDSRACWAWRGEGAGKALV